MLSSYQVVAGWEAYEQEKDDNQARFWSLDLISDLSPVKQRNTVGTLS